MEFLLIVSAINLRKMVKMLEINFLKHCFLNTISLVYQFSKNIIENRVNIFLFSEA